MDGCCLTLFGWTFFSFLIKKFFFFLPISLKFSGVRYYILFIILVGIVLWQNSMRGFKD